MTAVRQGGFLIAKVHHLAGRIFALKPKNHGLGEINPAQGRILFALWEHDDIPLREVYAQVSEEMNAQFYEGFTVSEIERFEEYLARILDNLTAAERG